MKFVVSQPALQNELQFLQGIAEKKKTIPILSNILLRAEGDFLTLAATDLEVSLTAGCEARIEEPGGITVSAKKIFEVVRSLEDEVCEGEPTMTVHAGGVEGLGGAQQLVRPPRADRREMPPGPIAPESLEQLPVEARDQDVGPLADFRVRRSPLFITVSITTSTPRAASARSAVGPTSSTCRATSARRMSSGSSRLTKPFPSTVVPISCLSAPALRRPSAGDRG